MKSTINQEIAAQLEELKSQGLFKKERVISTPQSAEISAMPGGEVLNFCANNY